jgi:hypothetical protein
MELCNDSFPYQWGKRRPKRREESSVRMMVQGLSRGAGSKQQGQSPTNKFNMAPTNKFSM